MKRFFCIFSFLFVSIVFLNAQVEEGRIKASMLYYISDFIIWPKSKNSETFNIGVIGDLPDFLEEMRLIAKSRTLKGKQIKLYEIQDNDISEDLHLLFVASNFNNSIEPIFETCKKNNILLFTDQLDNKLLTEINFTKDPDNQKISFEVNKQNLILSWFDYTEDLLLYGGNILDIKELYQSTQKLLENESKKVGRLNNEVSQKNVEINEKNSTIKSLSENIEKSKQTLLALSDSINRQHQVIFSQKGKIAEQDEQFSSTKNDLIVLQDEYQRQMHEIKTREEELTRLDAEIKDLDADIEQRENLIKSQSQAIDQQKTTIKAKNKILFLLVILGSSLLLIGILLIRANNIKRRYNKILERKVEERTRKINEANRELIKSERNYKEIFNSSTDAIFIMDTSGKIFDVNSSMLNMYGYKKFEVDDLSIEDLSADEAKYKEERVLELIGAAQNTKISLDWLAKRKNGEVFWVNVALKHSSIGGQEKVMAVVRDIDEKKKNELELDKYRNDLENMVIERTAELKSVNKELMSTNEELKSVNEYLEKQKRELEEALDKLHRTQDQLVESEKMASVGTLAAGVAHEINNPLNFIQGGIYGLTSYFEDNLMEHLPKVQKMLESIEIGVQRSSDIVNSLNHFSRKTENMHEDCDMHEIIENCLVILQNNTKDRVEIEKDYSPNYHLIEGNDGKLHQVMLNILTNAAQAINGNGTIKISTFVKKNKIEIKIEDSGSGIPEDVISRITDPFFTTKDPGEGTGLGLAITQRIIKEHQGELMFKSKVGEGTIVNVSLPLKPNASL